jgi:hypothetical protein
MIVFLSVRVVMRQRAGVFGDIRDVSRSDVSGVMRSVSGRDIVAVSVTVGGGGALSRDSGRGLQATAPVAASSSRVRMVMMMVSSK